MKANIYTTTEKDKMQQESALFIADTTTEGNLLKVYPNTTFQRVIGFGGAFTESAGYVYSQMCDENKKEFLKQYFSDNCYNLGRLHIQSCDFSLSNYCYLENENDIELHSFSLKRDEKYIIPLVKDALKINPDMRFIASPWSPPPFMKTNGEMNHGGKLKKEYYSMWAKIIAKYVYHYRNDYGIIIDRLTVQNEPNATQEWDSCIFSAEEESDFACNYLRCALDNLALNDVKLLCHDHNKDNMIDRAEKIFSLNNADKTIDGIAFHWYSGEHFEALDYLSKKYPEKELFFSEGCVEYSCHKDKTKFENAQRYIHELIGDFNNGITAVTDWNLLLDEFGGPNHTGNLCEAPIMYEKDTDKLIINDSYYAIGHFSRFVKSGAKRILVSLGIKLEAAAFKNPDGTIVIIVSNHNKENIPYTLRINDKTCSLISKANSIQTIAIC